METEQCSTESPLDEERNKEIKDFLKFNENDHITYSNYVMKAVLRGEFIAINVYIKK